MRQKTYRLSLPLGIGLSLLLLTTLLCSGALAAQELTRKVTVAFAAESNVLDVTKAAAGVDWYYIQQVNEMLVGYNPQLQRENWLAESWKLVQEEGHPVIDVHLRKGLALPSRFAQRRYKVALTNEQDDLIIDERFIFCERQGLEVFQAIRHVRIMLDICFAGDVVVNLCRVFAHQDVTNLITNKLLVLFGLFQVVNLRGAINRAMA